VIIHPQLPSGFVIFCDDVREEVNGKLTFVGTYAGEMTVYGTAPATVPMLCVVARYREDPKNLPRHIVFKVIKSTAEEETVLLEVPIDAPAPTPEFDFPVSTDKDAVSFFEIAFISKISPLQVTGDFHLKVRAYVEDDEVRLGTLRVKLAPLPTDISDQDQPQ
jgi:hypothetical protein